MANVKISQLPAVSSLSNTDVLPAVATSTTSKITLGNLANSITGVTSSISASLAQTASFVKNAQTASYVLNAVTASFVTLAQTASFVTTAQTASYVDGNSFTTDNKALSASNAITASYVDGNSFTVDNPALSASYALTASYALNGGGGAAFPFTGDAHIYGKLVVTGSLINGAVGNVASGLNSHAEGFTTTTTGQYSHAEGFSTTTIGQFSHAEGLDTDAIGTASHAEGRLTKAVGDWSHAEGSSTYALGAYSHAEGRNTLASASYSHAEGHFTTASALYSHTEGYYTIAQGWYQHVQGTYNVTSTNQYAFIVGNGIDDSNRSNLVYASGSNFEVSGSLIVTGSLNVSNGYAVLTQVSESLNFADDTAAAAGGVPLGGIYRSGNFIAIRLV